MRTGDAVDQEIWRFVRGDVVGADFEKWAYGETDLETELGKDLYYATVSTDYSSKEAVWTLRCALASTLGLGRQPVACVFG